MSRWIGRCRRAGCDFVVAVEGQPTHRDGCPRHRSTRWAKVRGRVNASPCGPSCLNALGTTCACSCGGANHGLARVAAA